MPEAAVVPRSVVLDGVGLHSGAPCRVSLSRSEGPLVFGAEGREAAFDDLRVTRTDFGVEVSLGDGGPRIDGIEHLAAALAGLSIRSGVRVLVSGGEVPLLDGGAAAFCRALDELRAPEEPPRLVVRREDSVEVGASSYTFLAGESSSVVVDVQFDAPRIGAERASWDGSRAAFLGDVAWARTFGFRRDAAALLASGRARGANAASVMILADDGSVEAPGAAARPGEFARHKLLDFVGDAMLFGGPPRGAVHAVRPGHRATREAFAAALERGILVVA
ncbi:MAG TPA: UDP-3-O-acyl-N-acetylglucosamine deacetylase [Polyangiaceae bacterium]|nr:UDP-3-O-acyl-N-acetylglucosamine deacetylase [Polyangiaceae bacterium]